MNNMNEIIAKLRKDAGFTQEQLANMIGVSAQTVSKWETGTTMPDIMLLPIIADIFNTDIDCLFGRENKSNQQPISQDDICQEAYNSFFELLPRVWGGGETDAEIKSKAQEIREYIKSHSDTQTMIISNSEGNGVYADCNIALTLNRDKNKLSSLFEDDVPWIVLKRFADGNTREVYKFIIDNGKKSFTSSFVSAKCGIELSAVERALNHLLCMNLISRKDVDTGDGIVYIYSIWAAHKLVLVYSMLALASRLGNYVESYRGFMT